MTSPSRRSTLVLTLAALITAMLAGCSDRQTHLLDARVVDATLPDAVLPDAILPDAVLPDATLPDAALPDAVLPDAALPDAALPDAALPDAALPDAALPDAALPDAALPDAALPDAALPDAALPDAALPDAALPIGTPGNPGLSCSEILAKGGSTGNGVYWVKPLGSTTAFKSYCDMTTHGGGWTLVAGIAGTNQNHMTAGAVTPGNLVSATGKGKLADTVINALKGGKSPAFRMTCRNVTGFFQTTCVFSSISNASKPCVAEAYTYPPTAYGTIQTVQALHYGVSDGSHGFADRLIYGRTGSPSLTGCDSASGGWGGAGSLWVR